MSLDTNTGYNTPIETVIYFSYYLTFCSQLNTESSVNVWCRCQRDVSERCKHVSTHVSHFHVSDVDGIIINQLYRSRQTEMQRCVRVCLCVRSGLLQRWSVGKIPLPRFGNVQPETIPLWLDSVCPRETQTHTQITAYALIPYECFTL